MPVETNESEIQEMQTQQKIDSTLKVKPGHHLIIPFKKLNRYAFTIERKNGTYYVYTLGSPNSKKALRPLMDLEYIRASYESEGMSDRFKEQDALIHQLFGLNPPLLEFLFKGITQFHQARGDKDYQQCTGYNPESSIKSLSPR
jgi:hypothetical protein